jgi:hypothetical protein
MEDIFALAAEVILWVCEESSDTFTAFRFLHALASLMQKQIKHLHSYYMLSRRNTLSMHGLHWVNFSIGSGGLGYGSFKK